MSTSDDRGSRHMSKDNFLQYVASGNALDIPIPGDPSLSFLVRPESAEVGIRAKRVNLPKFMRKPPASVSLRSVQVGNSAFTDVVLTDPATFSEGYDFLCSIADRMQLDQMSLVQAFEQTLENLRSLIAPAHGAISRERELGLIGELLMLRSLVRQFDVDRAIESWRAAGDPGAEHDFSIGGVDVEVKTTARESRTHYISSLTQLVPSSGRRLWLISHQLTSAGGPNGSTLRDLASSIRSLAKCDASRFALEKVLTSEGWPWTNTDLSRWILRSEPQAFAVLGLFPRLSTDVLVRSGVEVARLRSATYEVDLTGYFSEIPVPQEIDVLISLMGDL